METTPYTNKSEHANTITNMLRVSLLHASNYGALILVKSFNGVWKRKGQLTERQFETLRQIYSECGGQ